MKALLLLISFTACSFAFQFQDSLAVKKDSVSAADSSRTARKKAPADTLKPIYYTPYDDNAYTISNTSILTTDYRDMGDILDVAPFTFVRRLGTVCQPDEVNFYGYGLGSVSYLQNGTELNNRLFNNYDINYLLTEDADSIRISNLVRGFFESDLNNPVAVNIIAREDAAPVPYSRVKYYEGPFDEAMVDFRFAQIAYNKFGINFDLKNAKAENSFDATSCGIWTGRTSLKYYLNDHINLALSYNYSQADQSLNGGVDLDSIKAIYDPSVVEEVLYDEISAPVKFTDRYVKKINEVIRFQGLLRYGRGSITELNVYAMDGLDEFRQNENSANGIKSNFGYHATGFEMNNNLVLKYADLYTSVQYEKNVSTMFANTTDADFANLKAAVKGKLFGGVTPSVFVKIHTRNNTGFLGAGADLSAAAGNFIFYTGASLFERAGNTDGLTYELFNFEASAKYISRNIKANTFMFLNTTTLSGTTPVVLPAFLNGSYTAVSFQEKETELFGAGADIEIKTGFITTELRFNYMNSANRTPVPEFSYALGVYYTDVLFDSSLNLKSGLILKGNSSFQNSLYDHIYQRVYGDNGDVPANGTLDFFTAGKIQDAAYAYFSFENLLDRKYYLIPYYPMHRRGIRFGIAWEFLN